jgi:uroporphyrinogen-III synthase
MENCKAKRILVLSNIIKSELAKFGLKNIFITKEPNEKSMIDLIIKISQKRY